MLKFRYLPVFVMALAALSACRQRVEIKDGMIPNELLPYTQALVGEYRGQMDHKSNSLNIRLDGNRLVVTATEDLVASFCESRIGALKTLSYKEKEKVITLSDATLEFSPALCSDRVLGRQLSIRFRSANPVSFDVTLLDHEERYYRCEYTPGPVYPGHPPIYAPGHPPVYGPNPGPIQRCYWEYIPYYLTGHFVKN